MPAKRPRASFEPIPPDFDLNAVVESTFNFQYADRVSCEMIDQQGMENFDKLVLLHVIMGGKPLVIEGYQHRYQAWNFSAQWLAGNHGDVVEQARNLADGSSIPLTIRHYLKNMGPLTNQFFDKTQPQAYLEKKRQRVYLKDIDCPAVWQDRLKEHLPPNLFYLNESTGEMGGPGSVMEITTGGQRKGRGIAGAGDLMSSLPPPMRAENLMCYIGHEGTYTPAHREMCASLGHNIMVETSGLIGDDGKPEHPGSSIWFMTETKDRQVVSEYWLSILGHDIEVEKHFAQIAAWKNAPFTTYVVEQKAGDFILIPPLAPHQVWNRGTRTMKVAWNRTTVETLELAMKEALPRAKMVCRDEQYKNKAIIFYTLQNYSELLAKIRSQQETASSPQEAQLLRLNPKTKQLQKDFKRLFLLYKDILVSEMFSPDHPHERNVQFFPFDSNITCAYCRGNIFNKFLTCGSCDDTLNTAEPEPYDVCMECYAMGRSCGCISKMKWAEQFKWKELAQKYEHFGKQYMELIGHKDYSPLTIQEERQRMSTKTLAQVCQEQLKRRPWVDVRKPVVEESDEPEETMANDDGTAKQGRTKKRKSESYLKNHRACHVCCHRHPKWKMSECKCGRWWCYGVLFRAFDLMPQTVMEDPDWTCPHCRGICSAGNCRKDPRQNPYPPTGTLLGHDTRKVADARSVESLVDFSVSNLNWLGEGIEAPLQNKRLERAQLEAHRAKQADADLSEDHHATDDEAGTSNGIHYSPGHSVIDPQLHGPVDLALAGLSAPNGQPDSSNGFVAPAAVMYRPPPPPQAEAEDSDSMYHDMYEQADASVFTTSRKRKAYDDSDDNFDREAALRRKQLRVDATEKNVSGATRQYRREQEKKALEEARAAGCFIQVNAALKGKRRLVKLHLSRDALLQLKTTDAAQRPRSHSPSAPATSGPPIGTLLESDIRQPPQLPEQPLAADSGKRVRIRVEHDDDFTSGRRRRTGGGGGGGGVDSATALGGQKKKKGKTQKQMPRDVEEIEMPSTDSEGNDVTAALAASQLAVKVADNGEKRRRISSWQSRRQEQEQEQENLVDDADGDGHNGNASARSGGKGIAQMRPAASAAKDVGTPNEQQHIAAATQQQAEEAANRAAKLAAATAQFDGFSEAETKAAAHAADDDDDDDDDDDLDGTTIHVTALPALDAAAAPATTASSDGRPASRLRGGSVTSRRGRGGAKVRIVGSASRRRTTGYLSERVSMGESVGGGRSASAGRPAALAAARRGTLV